MLSHQLQARVIVLQLWGAESSTYLAPGQVDGPSCLSHAGWAAAVACLIAGRWQQC